MINEDIEYEIDNSEIFIQETFTDNKRFIVISYNSNTFSQPTFSSFEELNSGLVSYNLNNNYSEDTIYKGSCFPKGVGVGIQLERNSPPNTPFTSNDLSFLSLLCSTISSKLEAISIYIRSKSIVTDASILQDSIIVIASSKTILELLRNMLTICINIGFQHNELIFYNKSSND